MEENRGPGREQGELKASQPQEQAQNHRLFEEEQLPSSSKPHLYFYLTDAGFYKQRGSFGITPHT